jgi:uncharacterized membrane protein
MGTTTFSPVKLTTMNVKRVFGTLLSLFGIIGLIYAAYMFVNTSGGAHNVKTIAMSAILGLIFFSAGVGLMRTIRDDVAS